MLGLLLTPVAGQPRPNSEHHDWRRERHPRIDLAPDPCRIHILPDADFGWARVTGQPGAAADRRAKLVRVVNLATADEVATAVKPDGSFSARLFAPPGSTLQVTTLMLDVEELPFELRQAMQQNGYMTPSDMPHAELYVGLIGSHLTCSPGTILPLVQPAVSSTRWPAFVRKVGQQYWLLGSAFGSTASGKPGDTVDLDIDFSLVFGSRTLADVEAQRPHIAFALHRLFDRDGCQRSFARQPTSDVLTPTGLPIETHGEMVVGTAPGRAPRVEPRWHGHSRAAQAGVGRGVAGGG